MRFGCAVCSKALGISGPGYYVYELIDPRTNGAFYVGKGRGNRALHHLGGVSKNNKNKTALVEEIRESGLEPEIRVVREFDDEQAAYDFEREHIEEIGLENLTNVRPGGGTGRFEAELKHFVNSLLAHEWKPISEYPKDKRHWPVMVVNGIKETANLFVEKWGDKAVPLQRHVHGRVQAYLKADEVCGTGDRGRQAG